VYTRVVSMVPFPSRGFFTVGGSPVPTAVCVHDSVIQQEILTNWWVHLRVAFDMIVDIRIWQRSGVPGYLVRTNDGAGSSTAGLMFLGYYSIDTLLSFLSGKTECA
jgi:hypothetical protein